ncbi:MAG TPA: o-succinylbenzoate--CoA ligase [Chloroflexota bacterium]|nr:o-succinylbenzoate--CoA ligase [Chloroflexota bacterium]
MTVSQMPNWLLRRAATSPDSPALVHDAGALTFAQLSTEVDRLALGLLTAGCHGGMRIGILTSDTRNFTITLHALTRIGAVAVPLAPTLTPAEMSARIAVASVSGVVVDDELSSLAGHCLLQPTTMTRLGMSLVLTLLPQDWPSAATSDGLFDHIQLDGLHSIVFTSGTTAAGKGVELTHGNHYWNATGSLLNLGGRESDRWLLCLPPHHVGGMSILLRSLVYGVSVVAQDRFDPERVNHEIDKGEITMVSVVSTMLKRMLDLRGSRRYSDALRCVLLGGGPIPRPLVDVSLDLGVPIAPTYGLTEAASQVSTLRPSIVRDHRDSAGQPLFQVDLVIESDTRTAKPGQPGEILVRGPSISSSYCDGRTDAWRGGWFHTGDVGVMDEEGYLQVLDRRGDLIVSGGENVYPSEVESVLSNHGLVREAAVFGAADGEWGHMVVAALVPTDGAKLAAEEVRRFARQTLAAYKVPKRMVIVEELPKTGSGKILRAELRRRWEAHGLEELA